jgi:uncharacterized membrane protein
MHWYVVSLWVGESLLKRSFPLMQVLLAGMIVLIGVAILILISSIYIAYTWPVFISHNDNSLHVNGEPDN